MDTIRQFEGAMADGGPGAVARALVEACVNEVMSARADAMCEETGTSRNGFRERGLETQVGAITLRIPRLREGTCFPEGVVERRGRVDRAVICAASEMFAPGVSTRKVGKVLEKMGLRAYPSPSARTESAGWSASHASTPSPTPAGRASCAGFASAASKGCGA